MGGGGAGSQGGLGLDFTLFVEACSTVRLAENAYGFGQVLLNLLVAMLSNTYEENHKDAQQGWKLHRASVLVRIDRSMTAQQRMAPDKVFWQTSPNEQDKRCR
jgi:hypothetical protein